ncbi:restriction endonuclease subunit S [Pseudanabaena galeata UHCC 0370]|uniref:Restriction endonuclease subunit S n=1 Tax=Pseudanabaena galeata UHCC 0370 TaxID=3110310 RepID=A0ABU5TN27_9CYAN|nr:restriction endonuclease subunit S [Pseudanabaena galeata]MEA5479664.1 restriction endonuclease subunit S [Pseudanabaena galeata UHCC 0370]
MRVDIVTESLGKICDVRDGTHDSPKYVENGFYLLTSKNFSSGKISYEGANKISIEDYNAINKRSKVDIGDIVMPMIGTIGSPVIISQESNFAIKNVALIKRNENVCMNYICAFLASSFFEKAIKSSKRGGTQKFVSLGDLRNLKLPLPPIAEQKRIAEILDRTQSLISKRKEAIAQLDTLTQSIFLEMFGDPVTNPKGLGIKKFKDIGTLDRGVSKHRPRNAPELLGGIYPLIQTGDVANCGGYIRQYQSTYSEIGLRQSKMWRSGTLCITIAANIAKTGILTFDSCFPDSVVGFLSEDLATIEFVRVWLSFLQKTLEETAPESAQKNINLAILRDLNVPFPPLPLQKEFAQRVEAVEKLKATHRASLSQLQALFASLQHRAFRGEL